VGEGQKGARFGLIKTGAILKVSKEKGQRYRSGIGKSLQGGRGPGLLPTRKKV